MLSGASQLESPPCHRLSTESIFRFFDLEIRFVQECPHDAIMAVDLLDHKGSWFLSFINLLHFFNRTSYCWK